ncbi:MAG TPA: TlpA family protein disulfide reductase, partial [Candidatus Omnitrophota bacterium]|nr:TlpA family protein disulfide reductase [Candidatus Omnitrophota bacterium]
MKMKKSFMMSLAALFLFTSSLCMASANLDQGTKTGIEAPSFSLEGIDGSTVALSDMKGKNVMLFFFATWCPWCRKSIPDIIKNQPKLKKDNVEVLLIDAGESKAKVASFAEKQEIPFNILL